MNTVSFHTIGCKLNQYETQTLIDTFRSAGFCIKSPKEVADVCIINTCCVTHTAEQTARNLVRRIVRLYPKPYVVVTGCYARLNPSSIKKIRGVDLIEYDKAKICRDMINVGLKPTISSFSGHTRAFVKIQDGCNNFCSFCILPFVRGKPFSRPHKEILQEVETIAERGYMEVILTGINLGDYRDNGCTLTDLLRSIEVLPDLYRLRISSIEPHSIGEQFVDFLKGSKKICRHLHIPLQSGDDEILKKMRRRYTTEQYARMISLLKRSISDLTIGADVIVGFPGESEENFQRTCDFIRQIPLSYLHVFRYSTRPQTEATTFRPNVSEEVKKIRSGKLREIGKKKWREYRTRFLGKTLQCLVENKRDRESKKLVGISDNYIKVLFEGQDSLMGEFVPIQIENITDKFCIGTLDKRKETTENTKLTQKKRKTQPPAGL